MKTVIVKVNNATQVVAEHQVVTKDGQPTVIKATNKVNYELVDQATGRAPDHIITKRVGKDLHVSVDESGEESDLIIEGYYDEADSALIGQAEDGSYYYYVPDTGEVEDFVTELAPGDAEGQALGGNAYPTPWWVGATDEAGFGILPWLVGLAGLGALIAAIDDDDDNDYVAPPVEKAPLVIESKQNNPDEDGDGVADSTTITGTAEPNSDITVVDKDGNVIGTGKADEDGNFTVTTDEVLENGEEYEVISKEGDEVLDSETVTGDNTAPATPNLVPHEDGSVTVEPGNDADDLTVTFTDEEGEEHTVEVVQDPETGKWAPVGGDEQLPPGVTVDPENGKVTLAPEAVGDGTDVYAENTDELGNKSSATGKAGNNLEDTTAPDAPDMVANPDGSVEMTPSDDATSGKVEFTDENGEDKVVEIEKDPETGEWGSKDDAELPPGVTVDPETGKVTIDPEAVEDGSQVKGENSNENGSSNSEITAGDNVEDTTAPDAPDMVANPDGSVEMTPSDDATNGKVEFTDENGEDKVVEIEKDPETGEWGSKDDAELPPGVTVDPETGKVTIEPGAVEDGSQVKGENSNENGSSSSEVTAGDNDVETDDVGPDAPDMVANPDGSVEMTPSEDATNGKVEFTDESGEDKVVEIEKDPETGEWTPKLEEGEELPPGVTVDPESGKVTIDPEAVEDGSQVKGENSNENGSSSSEITAGDNLEDTTAPDAPDMVANPDGSVEMTPSEESTEGKVEFTDENGEDKVVEIEKDPETGEWSPKLEEGEELPPGVTVDPESGKVTIDPEAVEDGSQVKGENSNENGSSSSEIEAGDNVADTTPPAAPIIEAKDDGSVTVKPDNEDAVDLTVDFTDEDDQPQKVEIEKGEDGTWAPKEGTELPDGVTVNPETGEVEIHYDAIKDGSTITAENSDEAGNTSSSESVASRDPVNGPTVEIATGEDGVVDPKDLNEEGEVDVEIGFIDDTIKAGDTLVITGPDGEPKEVVVTEDDITKGSVTVPVKPAEHGEETAVEVEVKNPEGDKIGWAKDSAPTDMKVPGDTDGDGVSDVGPVISFPEDENGDGYLNAAEDGEPKGETPVRVELPVNTEAGDIVELTINGETQDVTLTEDNVTDGYVDVPVKLDTTEDGKVDLEQIDATAKVKDSSGNETPEVTESLKIDTGVPGDVDGDGNPSTGDKDGDGKDDVTGEDTSDTDDNTLNGAPIITFPEDTDGNGILSVKENGDTKDTTPVQVSTPTNTEIGDTVVITINGEEQEVTVTEQHLKDGFVTVDAPVVPGEDGKVEDIEVEAYVKDEAGNQSNTAEESLAVDLAIPGDSNGDGIIDESDDDATTKDGAPIITFPEDTDGNGILSFKENGDTKDTTPVQVSTPANTEIGDTVVITINGEEQEVTVTEQHLKDGFVTVDAPVVPGADGKVADIEVEAYVKDDAGNQSNTAKDSLAVDLIAPGDTDGDGVVDEVPVVTIPEAKDGVNAEELEDGVQTNVTIPEGTEEGDTITLTVTNPDGTTSTVEHKVTQGEVDEGTAEVTIPKDQVPEDGDYKVVAEITDPAGNTSGPSKEAEFTVDATPTDAPIIDILEGNDNVIDNTDLNEDGNVDVKVYLPKDAVEGDTLVVTGPKMVEKLDAQGEPVLDEQDNPVLERETIEIELTQADIDAKSVIVPLQPTEDDSLFDVTAQVVDEAGNESEIATDDAMVGDITAPDAPVVEIQDMVEPIAIPAENIEAGEPANGEVPVTITLPEDVKAGNKVTIGGQEVVLTDEDIEQGDVIVNLPEPAEGETLDTSATINNGGTIEASEVDEDGNVDVVITLPENAKAGDTLTINGEEQVLSDDDITAGKVETKAPAPAVGETLDVVATITDAVGNTSDEGKDSSEVKSLPELPVDPDAPKPEVTVDLQDMIDLTDDAPAVATIKGTTENVEEGTEVEIEIGVYKDGEPVEGQPTKTVKATVDAEGNYVVNDVDLSDFPETDNTGDPEKDALTIGAVAKVKTSFGEAKAEDLDSEIGKDGGLNEDNNPDVIESLAQLGLNNDMNLVYGPSKTKIINDRDPSFVVSEDTSYTDPVLFTNYDDELILPNQTLTKINADLGSVSTPNDGRNPEFGSIDKDGGTTTIDTGMGDDKLVFKRMYGNTRLYMGEGDDTFELHNSGNAASTFDDKAVVYMEGGDDTVIMTIPPASLTSNISGKIYTGSGSDTVTIDTTNSSALIDLGSGNTPEYYLTEYQDGSGLSLGNDDNTDLASDHNKLTVNGTLRGTVVSGIGTEEIDATSIDADIDLSDGDIDVTVAENMSGTLKANDGVKNVTVNRNSSSDITFDDGDVNMKVGRDLSGTLTAQDGTKNINVSRDSSADMNFNEGDVFMDVGRNLSGVLTAQDGTKNINVAGNSSANMDLNNGDVNLDVKGDISGNIEASNGISNIKGKDIDAEILLSGTGVANVEATGRITGQIRTDVQDDITGATENNDVIKAGSVGSATANATITTGKGEDTIDITGDVKGINPRGTTIDTGADNDTIMIGGTISTTDLWSGSGDDTITIAGDIGASSRVLAGTGNDTLNLGGGIKSAVVDMGSGFDTINMTGNGETIYLNDVVNTEVIDLSAEGKQSVWHVDAGTIAKNGSGNEDGILRIKGDSEDVVNIGDRNLLESNPKLGDWAKTGEQSADGLYDLWTDGSAQLYISPDITVI